MTEALKRRGQRRGVLDGAKRNEKNVGENQYLEGFRGIGGRPKFLITLRVGSLSWTAKGKGRTGNILKHNRKAGKAVLCTRLYNGATPSGGSGAAESGFLNKRKGENH